jgi:hypothetical protein
MVRSGQPTGVLIPVVLLFGGVESKAKNSKVAHEYAERREHNEFILVQASRELTQCLVLRFVFLGDCVLVQGSPRPPYIGQRMMSVPRTPGRL